MEILRPRRYPLSRYFVVVAMIMLTALVVGAAIEYQERMVDGLWSEEHRPHPWPWPGQDRWLTVPVRPTFDFGPVFERTGKTVQIPMPSASPSDSPLEFDHIWYNDPTLIVHSTSTAPWGIFIHDPNEHATIYNYDYRWVYINLRGHGSVKIDRLEGRAWFCPHSFSTAMDMERRWCGPYDDSFDFPTPILSPPECRSCDKEGSQTWEHRQ